MKRALSLLLAALLCSGTLAACAKDNGPDKPETTLPDASVNTTDAVTTDDGRDSNGFLRDTLPADLKFEGETVTTLGWDSQEEEFEVEEMNGALVDDAIYTRNRTIEERLGVTLAFYEVAKGDGYIAHVANAIQSGSHDFDMLASYSMTTASCGSAGYLLNLLDLPYLDFDMPWWPERLTEEATINGKLYFASGDISANMLYMMYLCFYNKDMLANYSLEDPQQLVLNNQWTYDKFFSMCKGLYRDLNGDGQKDAMDQFGWYHSPYSTLDMWFFTSGNRLIDKDTDGKLIISPTYASENALKAIELLNENLWATNDCIHVNTNYAGLDAFIANRSLFYIDNTRTVTNNLAQSELNYGVVPCPVMSTDTKFVTLVGNPFGLWALPIDCRNPEMAAAVMECFASESYRNVSPALFENVFKTRYSDTAVDAQMYDIIRENVTFDLGRLYNNQLSLMGRFVGMIDNNQNNWASSAEMMKKFATAALTKIQQAYE